MAPKNKQPAGTVGTKPVQSATSNHTTPTNGVSNTVPLTSEAVSVNKKKQKRREKEAERAQRALSQHQQSPQFTAGKAALSNGHSHSFPSYDDPNFAAGNDEGEDVYSDDQESGYYPDEVDEQSHDGTGRGGALRNGKNKKQKKTAPAHWASYNYTTEIRTDGRVYMPRQPTISTEALRTVQRKTLNSTSIWDTNSSKERAAIKDFWIGLTEAQRKDLVNIEKSHVLQKMKEQQKHSCSCTVCGRKRTAIEEELEILYEEFLAHFELMRCEPKHDRSDIQDRLQDPRIWADPTVEPPPNRLLPSDRDYPSSHQSAKASHNRIQEIRSDNDEDDEQDDDDDCESVEEEDEDDEGYSDEDYSDDASYTNEQLDAADHGAASQFFKFGNSLTVKDGVLSVADDLLKNDGQKFIDMMEHLAERRMQREQESSYHHSHYPPQGGPPPAHSHSHAHAEPAPDGDDEGPDDDEDDEDDDEYDSQEEYAEDGESDDIDHLDENERMEEGRRMFQIFAARMFEQRVVQAYKEKVATDRQNALIAAEESHGGEAQSEARKAKAAEKKRRQREKAKEAKAQKEAAKEEERKRKETAQREVEEKKKEEQRQKQEEARKRKEAEREALAEKKRRKEAEAQKRIDAERERQAEVERKQREQKAEEKRKREDAERKKREEKEAREKELRDKKSQEEREKKAREQENQATPTVLSRPDLSDSSKRPSVPAAAVALPTLQSKMSSTDSPQLKIAAPVLPKPPTPHRSKDPPSRQTSTPQTPERTPQSKQSQSPRSTVSVPIQPPGLLSRASSQQSSMSQPPLPSSMRPMAPPGMGPPHPGPGPIGMMPGYAPNGMDPRLAMAQGMPRPMVPPQGFHPMPNRPYVQTSFPSGKPLNMQSRVNPGDMNAFNQQLPPIASPMSNPAVFSTPQMPISQHSRQPSSHVESPPSDSQQAQPAPIGSQPRAGIPIRQPGSVAPGHGKGTATNNDVDELSQHLGSKALLSDENEVDDLLPAPQRNHHNRQSATTPGMTPLSGFSASSGFDHTPLTPGLRHGPADGWPGSGFGAPGPRTWTVPSGWGNSNSTAFGANRQRSAHVDRQVNLEQLRSFAVNAYNILANQSDDGFVDEADMIHKTSNSFATMNPVHGNVTFTDVQQACQIKGHDINGRGSFATRVGPDGRHQVRWVDDSQVSRGFGALGSPTTGGRLPSLPGLGASLAGPGCRY